MDRLLSLSRLRRLVQRIAPCPASAARIEFRQIIKGIKTYINSSRSQQAVPRRTNSNTPATKERPRMLNWIKRLFSSNRGQNNPVSPRVHPAVNTNHSPGNVGPALPPVYPSPRVKQQ